MKGSTRPSSRPASAVDETHHETNGHLSELEESGLATAIADELQVAPFTPSSPSVELDPARLAPELRAENLRLHQLLEQARKRLAQAEQTAEQWNTREQVYENLLEEKSELIRELHQRLEDFKLRIPAAPATDKAVPNEEELISLHEELERERQQLKDDEAALMEQMRTMEVQMAGERATLARQRNELQRLHNELQHQLEIASRDAALRERLAPLYRLQEELQQRPSGQSGQSGIRPRPQVAAKDVQQQPAPTSAANQTRGSGFFRRMFNREG